MEIRQLNDRAVIIWKNSGETPLEALERFRVAKIFGSESVSTSDFSMKETPMTYAGRLDPLAEGELLILIGDECKKKGEYLKFDKEYEVEILFGVETDTYDALGRVQNRRQISESQSEGAEILFDAVGENISFSSLLKNDEKFVTFPVVWKQKYPPYSSRTVNGKQLHELARAENLPEEIPSRQVTLHLTEVVSQGSVTARDLLARVISVIDVVQGDFRQQEIKEKWRIRLSDPYEKFETVTLRVVCSSGTYMRSLAHELGKERGAGAIAVHIKRTHILTNRK
jgi:tRNA pseudouridine55 synthase